MAQGKIVESFLRRRVLGDEMIVRRQVLAYLQAAVCHADANVRLTRRIGSNPRRGIVQRSLAKHRAREQHSSGPDLDGLCFSQQTHYFGFRLIPRRPIPYAARQEWIM